MPRHDINMTTLTAGVLFLVIGVYGISVSPAHLADNLRWLWPVMLIGIGVALLLRPSRLRRQDGSSDEVGAERGEDGEVEEPGRSHDRGVGPLA